MTDEPTHLMIAARDEKTLCGLRTRAVSAFMMARFVGAHKRGEHGESLLICADCEQAAINRGVKLDAPE